MTKWTTNDIPDQSGRVVIITGANSGLGYEDTLALASKRATVIMGCRNLIKGGEAISKIRNEFPKSKLELLQLDLADHDSVRSFAAEFLKSHDRLDILINNAGVMRMPYSQVSGGLEIQIGTNHFGHFLLTGLLIDILMKTENSRIVNVSSLAHREGNIDFDDIDWVTRKYDPSQAYSDSKIANLYFTYELGRRLAGKDPIVVASHPGFSATNLLDHYKLLTMKIPILTQSAAAGALPTLLAATDPKVKNMDYYGPGGRWEIKGDPVKVESNDLSHDPEIARKLWEVSEKRTEIKFNLN